MAGVADLTVVNMQIFIPGIQGEQVKKISGENLSFSLMKKEIIS